MNHIYQLRIELRNSNPTIWRSVQVSEETMFSDLHDIIQLSMGWEDAHLYEFKIGNVRVYDFEAVIDDGTNPTEKDSIGTSLNDLVNMVKSKFTYVYDFGDQWEHVIQLEKILPEEKNITYPVCLDGERACPPEDCGGIWGYQEILNTLADKDHPGYDETVTWIGVDWNADDFDCNRTNALLQDYAEQWEEIDKETGEFLENFEKNNADYDDWDDDPYSKDEDTEDSEYEALKKFSSPEDVLQDEYERYNMEEWLKTGLEEVKSIENQTFERLRKLGFDEVKSHDLILRVLSIEWFYDLKYETDHLEERYKYNLNHLPDTPQELRGLDDALNVLNNCMKGVPFLAIEHLQNDSSDEATSAILAALRNHSDHQYCWSDCTLTPFWYALAAEGHLCKELIDPVIGLYEENANDSDWLLEQGQYLIGKLAEKYPDLTTQKVLEAMEMDVVKKSKPFIFYLFDAFFFCDVDKHKQRLLALLEHDELSWYDTLAATVADLQITEGLPVLKTHLEKLRANPTKGISYQSMVIEIEEAVKILEGELILDQEDIKPLSLKRITSWQDDLKQNEEIFYSDEEYGDNFGLSEFFDQNVTESIKRPHLTPVEPFIKEKTPGRNDPCPCGSGKKYKKCCMD